MAQSDGKRAQRKDFRPRGGENLRKDVTTKLHTNPQHLPTRRQTPTFPPANGVGDGVMPLPSNRLANRALQYTLLGGPPAWRGLLPPPRPPRPIAQLNTPSPSGSPCAQIGASRTWKAHLGFGAWVRLSGLSVRYLRRPAGMRIIELDSLDPRIFQGPRPSGYRPESSLEGPSGDSWDCWSWFCAVPAN
ncbi:hypothetical protein GGTG_14237 [Gaeumannomyces tritici R3-111a-1]|uniref:Uncharacterized protein n=1 Tax=Gaeumannomyces tritici (strain R3-111a-1) TaxID=644352 RepID=J3PL05_GAET3|nr:hypothetical protein GGTG_14237 [Gaeumannomyces tritici R3-111a-1]EJT68183.1 hypothetical protein GGTG_14237 [Gaeumannomyces tritici R3-111a-1]